MRSTSAGIVIVAVAGARLALTAITYTAPLWSRAPTLTGLSRLTLAAIAGSTSAGASVEMSWFVWAISAPTAGLQLFGK